MVAHVAGVPTPTIEQASDQDDPTITPVGNWTITWNEPAPGFIVTNIHGIDYSWITATQLIEDMSSSGLIYTLTVYWDATHTGTISPYILASDPIRDNGVSIGNTDSISVDNNITYIAPPVCTINQGSQQVDPCTSDPIVFDITWDVPVVSFVASDISVSGTAIIGIPTLTQVTNTNDYTFSVPILKPGTVIASIPSAVCYDATGFQSNSASTSTDNQVTLDVPYATVEQASNQSDPTSVSPVHFDIIWSEEPLGFDATDILLTGTSLYGTPVLTGGPLIYDAAIPILSSGTIIASIPAAAATDIGGSKSSWSSYSVDHSITIEYHEAHVTIEQGASQSDPTTDAVITFDVVFDQDVYHFTNDSIVNNGTAMVTNIEITGGPAAYTVTVYGMSEGTVILTIMVGSSVNTYGGNSYASTSVDNTIYFNPLPSVTIEQGASQMDPTTSTPVVFDVVWSEPVSWFDANDFSWMGTATVGSPVLTGGPLIYELSVSVYSSGTVQPILVAGRALSLDTTQSSLPSTSIDNIVQFYASPSVTINQASNQTDPTNVAITLWDIIFAEAVTGLTTTSIVTSLSTAGIGTKVLAGGPIHYTLNVTATSSGRMVLSLPVGAATSVAYGVATAASTSTDNTITYDVIAPRVTLEQSIWQRDPANTIPVWFTVNFSEPVQYFSTAGIQQIGDDIIDMTIDGGPSLYNISITPNMSANYWSGIYNILAAAAYDMAGNPCVASTSYDNSVSVDYVLPTCTIEIANTQVNPTKQSPIHYVMTCDRRIDITTLDGQADISYPLATAAINHAATTITQTDQTLMTFDIYVYPLESGVVTCMIDADMFQSIAGNNNTATSAVTTTGEVIYDIIAPNVTVNQAATQMDPVGGWAAQTIIFDVVFTENVTGFTWNDVATTGTTAGLIQSAIVSGEGTDYTIVIYAQTSGSINLTIPAGVAMDSASNGNTASTSTDNSITVDLHAPSVTIDRAAGQVYLASDHSGTEIVFTATFDTEMYDFNSSGVVMVTNTSASTISVIPWDNLRVYNISITGYDQYGTIQINIPAGVCYDRYGNLNDDATIVNNMVIYDPRNTTVTIDQAVGQADPINVPPLRYDATFSRAVDGFDSTDIVVTGGLATVTIIQMDDFTYEVNVWPLTTQSRVYYTVSIPGDATISADTLLNTNSPSTSSDNTIFFDVSRPRVGIMMANGQTTPTQNYVIDYYITFNDTMVWDGTGLQVGGSAYPQSYTITQLTSRSANVSVTGMLTSYGGVTLMFPQNLAKDTAGNANSAASLTVVYDVLRPSVTINASYDQHTPARISPILYRIRWSEVVIGFDVTMIGVTGTANPANVTMVTDAYDSLSYIASVTGMTNNGYVTLSIAADLVADTAGNMNLASTDLKATIYFDMSAPTVTVERQVSQWDPAPRDMPIYFDVVFSKPVYGFTITDVVLVATTGGDTSVTLIAASTDNTAWTVMVNGMTNSGVVTITVPAGVCVDNANNLNLASTSTDNTVAYHHIRPTVTINQGASQSDPSNDATIAYDITFSTSVYQVPYTCFDVTGTALPIGIVDQYVNGSFMSYTIHVYGMSTAGTVTVTVLANCTQDIAGNGNDASTSTDNTVTWNGIGPVATWSLPTGMTNPTQLLTNISVTVTWSSTVTWSTSTLTVSGSSVPDPPSVAGGPIYDVTVAMVIMDGDVTFTIPAGVATDLYGNTNAATSYTIVADSTAPTVTITLAPTQATIAGGITHFIVDWNEPVQAFNISGPCTAIASGTAGGNVTSIVQLTSTQYSVSISNFISAGTSLLQVVSCACMDMAGNIQSVTATSPSVTIDASLPYVTSIVASMDAATQVMTFVVTFSRAVIPATVSSCLSWTGSTLVTAPTTLTVTNNTDHTVYTIDAYHPTGSVGATRQLTIISACVYDLVGNTSPGGTETAVWDNSAVLILHGDAPSISSATGSLNLTITGGDVLVTGNLTLQGTAVIEAISLYDVATVVANLTAQINFMTQLEMVVLNDTLDWYEVDQYCASSGRQLCSAHELCSTGTPLRCGAIIGYNAQWVPIRDEPIGDYIQFGETTPLCGTYSLHVGNGSVPSWSNSTTSGSGRGIVYCCAL